MIKKCEGGEICGNYLFFYCFSVFGELDLLLWCKGMAVPGLVGSMIIRSSNKPDVIIEGDQS